MFSELCLPDTNSFLPWDLFLYKQKQNTANDDTAATTGIAMIRAIILFFFLLPAPIPVPLPIPLPVPVYWLIIASEVEVGKTYWHRPYQGSVQNLVRDILTYSPPICWVHIKVFYTGNWLPKCKSTQDKIKGFIEFFIFLQVTMK
jgi:hypothetical protein